MPFARFVAARATPSRCVEEQRLLPEISAGHQRPAGECKHEPPEASSTSSAAGMPQLSKCTHNRSPRIAGAAAPFLRTPPSPPAPAVPAPACPRSPDPNPTRQALRHAEDKRHNMLFSASFC